MRVFTAAKSRFGRPSRGRSSNAANAGDRVSALKAESAMEKAIVKANCWYILPVVPGNSETGTNTAISTSEVAMTAPVTSFMPIRVA